MALRLLRASLFLVTALAVTVFTLEAVKRVTDPHRVEPIEGSVTSVPVRRYTIQSAIMLSLAHASHSTGWHCRTQARRGGALSEIQPPPSR